MPPAIRTNVPAQATMMMPACWSRMFVRLAVFRNGGLMMASTAKAIRNGMRIPARLMSRADPLGQRDGRGAASSTAPVVMPRSTRRCRMRAHDRLLRHVRTGQLRHQAPAAHHQHPMRQAQDLLDLVRDQQDRQSARRRA